jgi:hypothetical protein
MLEKWKRSPHQRVENLFYKMTSKNGDDSMRSESYKDGTSISISQEHDCLETELVRNMNPEYRVTITTPSLKSREKSFTIKKDNTLKNIYIQIGTLTVRGDASVPTARAVVNWTSKVAKKEKFVEPKISILNK